MQPAIIPPRLRRTAAAVLLCAIVVALPSTATSAGAPPSVEDVLRAMGTWNASPAHRDLFAPSRHREAYRAFVSPLALDEVLRELPGNGAFLYPPGAWTPERLPPLDAFGAGGSYNRWALARLYRGEAARVARGPRGDDGLTQESWMLVSPYPDAALERLDYGTLLIVATIPPP